MSTRDRRRSAWTTRLGAALAVVAGSTALALAGCGTVPSQPPPAPPPKPAKPRPVLDPIFVWPYYGYSIAHTRQLPVSDATALHPPYRQRWIQHLKVLLEFPPVLGDRSLYEQRNDGVVFAIDRRSGRVRWQRRVGALSASCPGYANGRLYVVVLKRSPNVEAGAVRALDARTGRILWSRRLPSRAESSPVVWDNRVFFGSEDGTVYSLDARTGHLKWTYTASGPVKGSIAVDGRGHLYFGDYGGGFQSLYALSGGVRWRTSVGGGATIYSTPTVAGGKVFFGGTDGNVYALNTSSGSVAWTHSTGSYVYGSAAVATVHGRRTVFIGSYDGNMYALDAASGNVIWAHSTGDRISGSAIVLGNLLFYSTLGKTTSAVKIGTGHLVWHVHGSAFNPVVSDGRRLYVMGYSNIRALVPMHEPPGGAGAPPNP